MKKLTVAAVCLALFASGPAVFAQSQNVEDSNSYYLNVAIERIWPYRLGYVVQYRLPRDRVARAYVPIEWFASGDGRGELTRLQPGASWPSMTVFFRDGEFDHVRLNVHRSPSHESWGNVPQGVDIDGRFDGVESVELQF